MIRQCILWTALLGSLWVWSSRASAFDVSFIDVAESVGLTYVGASHGASWGDYDRDGLPDLFLSNHWNPASIFHNTGTEFVDVSASVSASLTGDFHAGAWGDFDHDGDRDLAIAVGAAFGGGVGANRLLERVGGLFIDKAGILGLQLQEGRGRTPLWLDWNNDGQLDIVFANVPRTDGMAPTTLFTQSQTTFTNDNTSVGFAPERHTLFATLYSNGPIEPPMLLVPNRYPFPAALYDYSSTPFVDRKSEFGFIDHYSSVQDVAIGDFDNDQQTELYLSLFADAMAVRAITTHQARAFFRGSAAVSYGLSFATGGQITVIVGPNGRIDPEDIKIGSAGTEASSRTVVLDAKDSNNWGAFAGDPTTTGLFIHYDVLQQLWFIQLKASMEIGIIVNAVDPIESLQSTGVPILSSTLSQIYLNRSGGVFSNVASTSGLTAEVACAANASADFDNDMDLDIYLVCSDHAGNLPNVLLENNGSGLFTSVTGAAGATGAIGGVGESTAVADFDNDGFIDILVLNGSGASPLSDDGPTQLFRNQGNSNHWLEISLRGIQSNADGIGAQIVIEAGGVTQYRLQDGGMHRFTQDDSRVHFGLGSNTLIDHLEIHWPSGIIQKFENVPADQILEISEIELVDSDNDAIDDDIDNCITIANNNQRDTNGDGYGNACDPDINNDGIVNFGDVSQWVPFFNTAASGDEDFDGDGVASFGDYVLFLPYLFLPPGPSALAP